MSTGPHQALSDTQAPERVRRMLTFAERMAYQYAIEEVYWRHRIWPKENPGPKPPLDAMISRAQLQKKVEASLSQSELVAGQRGWPISASELQAEMDRMASHSKQPDVLRELFAALGNDPSVIAECLARPFLVERILRELTNGRHGAPAHPLLSPYDSARPAVASYQTAYKLPEIAPLDCNDDTWTATSTVNAPDARDDHTTVWTGSEMIVWGGFNTSPPYFLNTGGRYNPATDSWTATSTSNAPTGRDFHAAVWTGSEMIVWGGYNLTCDLNTGGRYNPATDSWVATSMASTPLARQYPTAVWTGSEMVIWAGRGCCNNCNLNSGGRYNPGTDSWTATSASNAPEARWYHTVEWTGSEMIVWGGTNQTIYLNTGGKYDPTQDSWAATGVPNDVLGRAGHTAVWTGSEMIVWGGADSTGNDCNTGGRYNPSTDSWIATSLANAPSPRDSHTAAWTGTEMIVWGGVFCSPCVDFNDGGRYSPGTDSWLATSLANTPGARLYHTAVWTGSEMVVWGGYNIEAGVYLNTGGRYCAQGGPPPTPTPTTSPTPNATPTATATATPTATPTATGTATATGTTTATPTATATASIAPSTTPTATPTPTSRPTPTPRPNITPRPRSTPPPRP